MTHTSSWFVTPPFSVIAPHTPSIAADDAPGPRRALVLAGGGMRVAYQAGAIRALAEAGLRFAHGDGTSGGTINLAMLLSGVPPAEMCDRWRTLDPKAFASPTSIEEYLKLPNAMALGDADGVTGTVFPHLGIDVGRVRAARGIDGTFNVCNFTRKTAEAIPHTDIDLDLLVAGISLPIFMPPVRARGATWTDAVWIKDANLLEAVRRGADEIWLVWCIGNTPTYYPGAFRQYVHMIEMSACGVLHEELRRIAEINQDVAFGERPYGRTRPVVLHVIKPRTALPLDPDFFFGRVDARTLVALGYLDAVRYLDAMRAEGVPLTPEATQMQDEPLGITFRETMAGPFALGVDDPKAGAAAGERAATTLTMHATVTVHDVQRFVADPTHTGELVGEIDFPPLGTGIPARAGVFRLFSAGGTPGLKYMVYELGFQHDGRRYYLAGKKEVRNDAGLDMLSDTTTLFTRLHEGDDANGPVVGAGVLHLDMGDFAKLMSTIRPVGARSMTEGAEAVMTFSRFFAGQLIDSYGGAVGRMMGGGA
ncbi:Patatin [Gemmatirosa kalamazoonensis]|uniref:Patatin n=1 Tax=Gemmatirosa kalamazoonensis TaxID=861299 RepID=W0RNC3_9BACT|nr:patatin-like phospholipase family protein [Gemmatirosa kalamazoonensis]AHG91820.1 Patatin [Gemmatirosa kalamazoonensis]